MPKKFYCSSCGKELKHQRKAVHGKGIILDLIIPHECDGYVNDEVPEDKQTLIQYLESLPRNLDGYIEDENFDRPPGVLPILDDYDKRDQNDKKTTTAPEGVLQSFNNLLGN